MDCIVHGVARLSDFHFHQTLGVFPGGTSGKEPACQCRRCKRHGFDPGSGRSPEGRHGNPLRYSCLESPKDRGVWWATKSQTQLKQLSTHAPGTWDELLTFSGPLFPHNATCLTRFLWGLEMAHQIVTWSSDSKFLSQFSLYLTTTAPSQFYHNSKRKSLSHVQLFATPWTIQSMEFSRPEYWSGQPFPSPGDLPNPGTEPRSPVLQVILYQLSHKGSPRILEWVAHPFSSGSSQPRNQTGVSCIAGRFFTN